MVDKVVFLTNFLPPYRISLLKALEKRVGELTIYLSSAIEPNRSWQIDWGGLNVHVQKCVSFQRTWKHPHGFTETIYIHIPYDTLFLLLRKRPDVIISAELGIRSLQATVYKLIRPRSRLVTWATLSEYTEKGRGRLRLRLRKWILKRADAVIVNGESGARYIRQFGIDDQKIIRVPYTTDIESFITKTHHPELPYKLLYAGSLTERKGLLPFMEALLLWGTKHPEIKLEFHLAGEGPLEHTLHSMTPPENLSVNFLGFIQYHKLPEVYAGADIFILPTFADEWGLVVNEAMASGLPVLGSIYSQAVEELVEEGTTGWLFHPDRQDEILGALDRSLCLTPQELNQMGKAAQLKISRFTPEYIADCMLKSINGCE